jgi:hypothetical protein
MKHPPTSSSASPVATWRQFFKGRDAGALPAGAPHRTELGRHQVPAGFAPTEWANTEWAETVWPEGSADAPAV